MLSSLYHTNLPHEKGLNGAIYERGCSFIAAAFLILAYSKNEIFIDQKQKKNIEKLSETLGAIKNHWENLKNKKKLTIEKLAQLEKTLITEIHQTIYQHKRAFKTIKNELDDAENHLNWKQRQIKTLSTTTDTTNITTIVRKDTPISCFTTKQTEEWLRILSPQEEHWPMWFSALPTWEQNYFRHRLTEWEEQKANGIKNLGEFLGPLPSTIRRYPGASNAYVTSIFIDGLHGHTQFNKIRTSIVAPTKIIVNTKPARDELFKITRQNIEQLIVAAIQEKIEESKSQSMALVKSILPILLQTLYSPFFMMASHHPTTIMMGVLDELRTELSHVNSFNIFLEKHGLDPKKIAFSGVELLYANRPVGNARGFIWFTNLLNQQGRENRHTDKRLTALAEQKLVEENDPILRGALESYQKMPYLWNTLVAFKPSKGNPLAEMAALEQIIASKVGVRIGGCISGKDEEELVTQIAIAQQECFVTYGRFPPPYTAHHADDKKLRAEFIENVARAYLTGYGHLLAGENAHGCEGLKNVLAVFGKTICKKIIDIAPDYGINPKEFNPVNTSQIIANLNKLPLKDLQKGLL